MSPFYTHQEYLADQISLLDYTQPEVNCIEFGTGDGSAMIFRRFVNKHPTLKVVSYETDKMWCDSMSKIYASDRYIFHHIESWDALLDNPSELTGMYDLVFVDQAPWEARIKSIHRIKHNSKVVILHDYNFFNVGVVEDTMSVGPGSFHHKEFSDVFYLLGIHVYVPGTLVMFNKTYYDSPVELKAS